MEKTIETLKREIQEEIGPIVNNATLMIANSVVDDWTQNDEM